MKRFNILWTWGYPWPLHCPPPSWPTRQPLVQHHIHNDTPTLLSGTKTWYYIKGRMSVKEELPGGGRVGSLFCLEKTDFWPLNSQWIKGLVSEGQEYPNRRRRAKPPKSNLAPDNYLSNPANSSGSQWALSHSTEDVNQKEGCKPPSPTARDTFDIQNKQIKPFLVSILEDYRW